MLDGVVADNTTLCYIRYDESQVPAYSFPLYRGTCDPKEQYAYYPGSYTYKYPVSGQPNSRVSVHSYDVETRKIKSLALPDNRIEYIPRIDFAGDASRLAVTTLNRDQNLHGDIHGQSQVDGGKVAVCRRITGMDSSVML